MTVSLTLVLGAAPQFGAANWVRIGALSLQPSELAKICYIFAGAATLAPQHQEEHQPQQQGQKLLEQGPGGRGGRHRQGEGGEKKGDELHLCAGGVGLSDPPQRRGGAPDPLGKHPGPQRLLRRLPVLPHRFMVVPSV